MSKKRKAVYSGIGGQAVLEGIMMRNDNKYSVVVRKSDGTMETVVKDVSVNPVKRINKIPFIRGVFVFAESLKLGLETLEFSANFYGTDTSEPTWFDKFLNKLFGKHTEAVISMLTMMISTVICIAVFLVLPFLVSVFLERRIANPSLISIIEGVTRILIFILYAFVISLLKDTRRTFRYHGAEHKCINCIEHGKRLTVNNVRTSSRLHGRCGTNFIFIVGILTIVAFFFIKIDSVPLRILIRIAMIPLIAGVAYEILRLIGKFNNILTTVIASPGLALQFITTKEPDEEMIQVAINAVEAVFDWKAFLVENFPDDYAPEDFGLEGKKENEEPAVKKKKKKTAVSETVSSDETTGDKAANHKEETKKVLSPKEEIIEEEVISSEEIDTTAEDNFKMGEEIADIPMENSVITEEKEMPLLQNDEHVEEIEANDNALTKEPDNNDEGLPEANTTEAKHGKKKKKKKKTSKDNALLTEAENESREEKEEETSKLRENVDDNTDEEVRITAKEEVIAEKAVLKDYEAESNYPEVNENVESTILTEAEKEAEVIKTGKTAPIKLDFNDDFGFSPDDEEVPMTTMRFEPIDESTIEEYNKNRQTIKYDEEVEEEEGPLFSKEIVSIPMPDEFKIVEVIPEGGVSSRIYNLKEDEQDVNFNEINDDDIDIDNIIDEAGHLTLSDTDAFNRKLDAEFDDIMKRLGLDDND